MNKLKIWSVMALVASLVLAIGLVVDTSSAAADEPTKTEFEVSFSTELTDICPFPITLDGSIHITETDYFDKSGALVMRMDHSKQQDTFSANGKTLEGLPYTYNLKYLFDSNGNMTKVSLSGVYEKVPLPDGSLFISAGRTEFVEYYGAVILSPEKGNPGNIAAFCSALTP